MAAMDNTYGSLLLGLVISAVLYGVTVLQTFLYFRKYPQDRLTTKALVAILWLLDTCHLILCTIAVYWYLVTNFSNRNVVSQLTWSMEIQTDCNGLIGLIVQCFFAQRLWSLSKNAFLTSLIVVLACVHFGLGIVFTVRSFQLTSLTKFDEMTWIVGAGIGSAAAADLMIAGSLCYYLSKTRTGFHRTDSLITLLIIYSVTTGLITSILDVVIVITFSLMPRAWVWIAVFWPVGKCYVNSFLAALNSRESLRERVAPAQGSNFIQFSPVGNSRHRSDLTFPTPLAVSIQRDTVFRTDYSNLSLHSAVSSPSSPAFKAFSGSINENNNDKEPMTDHKEPMAV